MRWNAYNGCLYVSVGTTNTNPVFTKESQLVCSLNHLHEDPLPEPLGLGETDSFLFLLTCVISLIFICGFCAALCDLLL